MTVVTESTRDVGPGWSNGRRALWYHWAFYLKTWRGSVISTFLFPIMYLASMGLGVGHLVSKDTGLIDGHTYLQYVAPGLLAISAMQISAGESMWPVLASVKWVRTYHAAVATPLDPEDVVKGKLGFLASRIFLTCAVYAAVIAAFGAVTSPWAILLPFLGALIGLAFGAPLMAFATRTETDTAFTQIYRFLIVPMFLFSATFYPATEYPASIRWIVQVMPLYHGVALARSLAFGQGFGWSSLVHVAVLVVLAFVGYVFCCRTMRTRLAS
jgi:lipooligosaccharide transport system permease protein